MEIGHNVMHGQWDWMRDPKIHSTTWEWDNASPAELWKHSHNELHHTYTNVLGRDNDLGYGIMRVERGPALDTPVPGPAAVERRQRRASSSTASPSTTCEVGKYLKGRVDKDDFKARGKKVLAKIRRHATRDYVLHPLLSGPSALTTLTANATANVVRNLWTHSVIMCGHFPEGVETFAKSSIEGETRGEWYLRQMLGSANISGSRAMHFMTGNLSYQIEHHLFPDLPSNRYQEIAPKVRGALRALRADLHHRPAAQAGRLGLEEDLPAVPAEQLSQSHIELRINHERLEVPRPARRTCGLSRRRRR